LTAKKWTLHPKGELAMSASAHPGTLVDTEWLADHLNEPHVRVVEVGWDASEYESGHVPGAVAGWGQSDVLPPEDKRRVEALLSDAGIARGDTVVLYGGLSNLVAAGAFWLLKIYGHADVRLLDGGRQKWASEGRPLTSEKLSVTPTSYAAQAPNWDLRANKDHILNVLGQAGQTIVDARPVNMYTGKESAGMAHAGHIPTAVNIPSTRLLEAEGNFQAWQTPTTNSDGTFKSVAELRDLFAQNGVHPDQGIITYCVRGGLSTHMWFVLTQLLGFPNVREYDHSWAEWGNSLGMPIEQ
jgi:thiosulfate/3-mercaptopyruvate sulfurtransferase